MQNVCGVKEQEIHTKILMKLYQLKSLSLIKGKWQKISSPIENLMIPKGIPSIVFVAEIGDSVPEVIIN